MMTVPVAEHGSTSDGAARPGGESSQAHGDGTVKVHTNLLRLLDQAGWSLLTVDIDLTGERPRVEVVASRSDGLWVRATLDRLGRGVIERFMRERTLCMAVNVKGRRPLSPSVNDTFVGRTRFDGAKDLQAGLCQYVSDNAVQPVDFLALKAAWPGVISVDGQLVAPGAEAQAMEQTE